MGRAPVQQEYREIGINITVHNLILGLKFVRLAPPVFTVAVLVGLSACEDTDKDIGAVASLDTAPIQVFKSPSCRCCGKWVRHIDTGNADRQSWYGEG